MTEQEYQQEVEKAVQRGDIAWVAKEALERMRVNVGLLRQNDEYRRRLVGARRQIQIELLRLQAAKTEGSSEVQLDSEKGRIVLSRMDSYAKAMNDAVQVVGRCLPE